MRNRFRIILNPTEFRSIITKKSFSRRHAFFGHISHRVLFDWPKICYRQILEKIQNRPKIRDLHRTRFPKKSEAKHWINLYTCFCALDFSGNRARSRSQKLAYILVQNGIFSPHVGICHFKLAS